MLADIPGLIEGAAEGVGLGHDFLRHIERTKVLLHVVDVSGCEGRDPIEDFEKINHELEAYSAKLARRKQLVVANKMDLPDSADNFVLLKEYVDAGFDVESLGDGPAVCGGAGRRNRSYRRGRPGQL